MKKLFLFILTIVLFIPVVHAHDITLSTDITIPEKISASTKIEVSKDFGEYDLYYQWVSMDADAYASWTEFLNQQLELTVPGKDATNEEKEEYNNEIDELEASKNALEPAYNDEKWAKSNNNTTPFNESTEGVEVGDPYILWVKAVSKENTEKVIYNERLILYSIPEDDVESPETSDNVLVLAVLAVVATGLMLVSYKKSRA